MNNIGICDLDWIYAKVTPEGEKSSTKIKFLPDTGSSANLIARDVAHKEFSNTIAYKDKKPGTVLTAANGTVLEVSGILRAEVEIEGLGPFLRARM